MEAGGRSYASLEEKQYLTYIHVFTEVSMTQATFSAVPSMGTLWVDNSTTPPSLVVSGSFTGGGTPTGPAGTPNAAVVTVQGIAGGTAQPVSGTVTANPPTAPATGTPTNVASSATSVTVLAANVARQGATVYNDSTAILYLLLSTGGTASTTAYTVQVPAQGYYEVPFRYTGALIGIWASAAGSARVTEITA